MSRRLAVVSVPVKDVSLHRGNPGSSAANPGILPEGDEEQVCIRTPVHWAAPFFNPSGYASEAINFVLPLEKRLRLSIHHHNSIISRDFVDGLPDGVRDSLMRMAGRRRPERGFIHISHNPANGFLKPAGAAYTIGRTMFETDRIPRGWVARCNQLDEVWVPTRFNLETFARSGVRKEKLRRIPGAIDVHLFDPTVATALALDGLRDFNFLSVFEWTERKGWDILLRAYFEEFDHNENVALFLRTYMFSRPDASDRKSIGQRIREYAASLGKNPGRLPRVEILDVQLPLRDLPRLYRTFDAFVSASRGEGWGRPHMEAMAMGLPTIATGWSGNTGFMTDENSYLVDIDGLSSVERMEISTYIGHRWAEPSVKHLRKLMRRVVEHRDEARARGAVARSDIVRDFSQERVAEIVLNRLREIDSRLGACNKNSLSGQAEAGERSDRAGGQIDEGSVTGGPAVRWEGPQFTNGSLAIVNRQVCRRLIDLGCTLAVDRPLIGNVWTRRGDPYRRLKRAARRSIQHVDVHVGHGWPPVLTPPPHGVWVFMQPWEFGSLPSAWAEVCAVWVDEVWAYSSFVRDTYVRAGVPADRVATIPLGVDPSIFRPDLPPFGFGTEKRTRFLFVGGTIPRKGIDILLDVYARVFNRHDDVCLVIKDLGGDSFYEGQTAKNRIRAMQVDPSSPAIEYIDTHLSEGELAQLYGSCTALVHPYRGEGFGLPIVEAMACGVPVVVTGEGPSRDFCTAERAFLIPAERKRHSGRSVGTLHTVDDPFLFEPDREVLADALRYIASDPRAAAARGREASAYVRSNLTWDRTAGAMFVRLAELRRMTPRRFVNPLPGGLDLPCSASTVTPAPAASKTESIQQNQVPTLSLTMIVRDEESSLARCLSSVRDFVDEIIVIDTGSTDHTKDIAASFGARVATVLWDDDFAAARNRALAEASGAWILALDADEVIAREDAGRLRQLLRAPGKAAFTFVTRNYVQSADVQGWVRNDGTYSEEAGTGWVPSAKVRLFTSDPRIRWEGKVHESVEPAIRAAGIPVETCDIPIHHYGKMDRERTRRKGEMYRDVSLRAVENGNQILRTLVELARQESELGHHPEALEWWHQVLAKDPEHSEALAGMGGVLAVLGRFSDALEPLTRAINRDSTKKEAGVHLALVKLHLGDPAGARAAAGRVCTHYPEYPFALAALAAARFCLGEKDAGLELLGRLRAAQVNYTGFFLDLASRLTRSGRADYAVRFLETLVEADGPTPELAAVLVDSYRTLVTGAE